MLRRRTEPTGSIEEERAALHAQWLELDALKSELAERVRSVEERERELRAVLETARRDGVAPAAASVLAPRPDAAESVTAREAQLERRAAAVAQRERALAERERQFAATAGPPSDEQRLAEIESRLEELREAEKAFLRTQQELAARSDAVTQRERLVSQRERELDEREDAPAAEVAELEARLRKLEQQRALPLAPAPAEIEDTQGFSSGVRRLQQEGTRRRTDA